MTLNDEQIDRFNRRATAVRYLAIASGAFFAATATLSAWIWKTTTADFVKYTDTVAVYYEDGHAKMFLQTKDKDGKGNRGVYVTPDEMAGKRWHFRFQRIEE